MDAILVISLIISIIFFIVTKSSDFIKSWQIIKGNFKSNKQTYSIDKENANIGMSGNPRFGLSFMEIKSWDKILPDNGDGHTYVFPENRNVTYKIWGSHNIINANDLDDIVANLIITNTFNAESIEKYETSCDIIDYINDQFAVEIKKTSIRAFRLVLRYKKDKIKYKATWKIVFSEDIIYNLLFEAPLNVYDEFKELISQLISNFHILGPNSKEIQEI